MAKVADFCYFYLPHATKSDLSSKIILSETLSSLGFKTISGPEEVFSGLACSNDHKTTGAQHSVVLIWTHTFPSPKFLRSWQSRIPAGTRLLFNHLPRRLCSVDIRRLSEHRKTERALLFIHRNLNRPYAKCTQ